MIKSKFIKNSLIISAILLFTGCFYDPYPHPEIKGHVPDTITDFEAINTVWDDMNMPAPPILHDQNELLFSTNRSTLGGTFDLFHFWCSTDFSQNDGIFDIYAGKQTKCRSEINSSGNEFGPAIIGSDYRDRLKPVICFFASDRDQDSTGLNIYMTYPVPENNLMDDTISTPVSVVKAAALNSKYDDAYISFGPDKNVYFCSNREGKFHIYSTTFAWDIYQDPDSVFNLLRDSSANLAISKVPGINSDQDDKCPYIIGNTLFFVSNRAGGKGGMDIYRSSLKDNAWSSPENLSSVNTCFDEYRPVCYQLHEYDNWLFLFSSNRPGGLGGYDIYYAGIDTL